MIAILSAIAAPSWLAFVNRQRVAKVNDAVFSGMQEAQQQAKRTKYQYSVSFKTDDNVPQIAVHRQDINPDDNDLWKSLTSEVEVKPESVWVGTNINGENKAAGSVSAINDTKQTITFDQFGNMPIRDPETQLDVNSDNIDEGLTVVVAVPNNNNEPIESTKRCTTVITLLGSMQTNQGESCL
jgi:type II secretory pathway pseudopilin PulG